MNLHRLQCVIRKEARQLRRDPRMSRMIVIARDIYLKGNNLSLLWPQALALFLFGVLTLAAGVPAFRKRVD